MYQFKADTIESKIDQFETLHDELIFFKQEISDIKDDPGHDGLSRQDRLAIRQNLDSIADTLHEIEKLPDLITMTARLHHINENIERHADLWGIDSW